MGKIGRNQICPCGSGLKYKRCHGRYSSTEVAAPRRRAGRLESVYRLGLPALTKAAERLRIQQQGLGKRIESFERDGRRFVISGNTIYHSTRWKTFIDFLQEHFARVMGIEWLKEAAAKKADQAHPIMIWSKSILEQQNGIAGKPGEPRYLHLTGAALCYFGLAYSLYLLEHNVDLQKRYIDRLRNIGNFQGAYYELLVANVLIRAGFKLELEDETDGRSKHCEFSAVSPAGRKYWVEAKMRSVAGLLGKTQLDGVSPGQRDPTTRLTGHINEALAKPAADERLIFVDLNAPFEPLETGEPFWLGSAVRRLDARERVLSEGEKAYVFVTNLSFHRYLGNVQSGSEALAHGLGISDFSKPGYTTLIEAYKQKQKHLDAHNILSGLQQYPSLPSTFDGKLPSAVWGDIPPPVEIGKTYFFEDIGDGIVATVTTATVSEEEAQAYIGVSTRDGQHLILTEAMSPEQIDEWKRHPDVYFGDVQSVGKGIDNPFDLFEHLYETYRRTPAHQLLKHLAQHPDFDQLSHMDQTELALIYCERMTLSVVAQTQPELLKPITDL